MKKLVVLAVCLLSLLGIGCLGPNQQKFEYSVVAPLDKDLFVTLDSMGNNRWELVNARRAIIEVPGYYNDEGRWTTSSGIYEMIFKRNK